MFSIVVSPTLKQLKGNINWTKAANESKLGKFFKRELLQLANKNEQQSKWVASRNWRNLNNKF